MTLLVITLDLMLTNTLLSSSFCLETKNAFYKGKQMLNQMLGFITFMIEHKKKCIFEGLTSPSGVSEKERSRFFL